MTGSQHTLDRGHDRLYRRTDYSERGLSDHRCYY